MMSRQDISFDTAILNYFAAWITLGLILFSEAYYNIRHFLFNFSDTLIVILLFGAEKNSKKQRSSKSFHS